ncbi:MAG TPA: MBL fold metallo-hydrolase [Methanobacterium sp.]|jgi:hydroxyacylglutathione hydrolase|nr:MAG: MBL fold metallo-hydrolase [Methanobacterium sp.]HOI71827.1 MBL fold metallo-hydrolase [Methanobacterium sp.]HPX77731.1 MBL fold metallo-hydrolase [Methanobacterium sp.]
MIFETVKSAGLAHKSYFIGSGGAAAVIDPRRDCDVYLDIAKRNNLNIKYIFETHRNEDYVIGSIELMEISGAEVYHGAGLDFNYGNTTRERDKFQLGTMELEILETPGHTPESISITVKDKDISEDVYMIFTGDTLFAGETGRIDLNGESEKENNASKLYESIHDKILPLGNQVIIYPAHGAGSVCGADIREQELTTIGYEKKTSKSLNYSKEEFIEYKVSEKLYIPPYFKKMEELNLKGPELLCKLPVLKVLEAEDLKSLMREGAQIIDIRNSTSFGGAHIPHTLSIFKAGLSLYTGWLLDYQNPIVIVDEEGQNMDEIRKFLVRLGYDYIYGYLGRGFASWYLHAEPTDKLSLWNVQELKKKQFDPSIFILDVRKETDWEKGYVEGAHHIYLGHVEDRLEEIPRDKKVVVYCDSGNKSTIAASILKKNEYKDVITVLGSMNAWKAAEYDVVIP